MLVQMGNKVLSIFWRHHDINPKTRKQYSKRYTRCIIRLGLKEESLTLAEAESHVHKGDRYNKCLGRKLSLKRAIEVVNGDPASTVVLDRETRKSIWTKYAETTRCNFTVGEKKSKIPVEQLEKQYDSASLIN